MRLTKDEITLLVVVLLVLVTGAAVRHYRKHHPPARPVAPSSAEVGGARSGK